jgi:hypothetical protein
MSVTAKFRRPQSVAEFTRMLEFLLEETLEDIACVSPSGTDMITIEWNHAVRDSMPKVVIWIGHLEAELDAPKEDQEDWERQPA